MPGVLVNSMQAPRGGTLASEPPGPTWLEQAGASMRTTIDDAGTVKDSRLFTGYLDLERTMRQSGYDTDKYLLPVWQRTLGIGDVYDRDAMWRDIAAAKAGDAAKFAGLPGSREEFETGIMRRDGGRDADQATLARGDSFSARLAGGAVGSFTDPLNLATLPIGGGGKTILQTAAREAGINALVEALQQPFLASGRARLGETLTLPEAFMNVGSAALGGAVLGGAFKAVELHGPGALETVGNAGRSAQETALEKLWPHLPESIRNRWSSVADIPDSAIPDLVAEHVGDALTPDTAAAMHVLRREGEIAANNPFVQNGAGIDAYAEGLRSAMVRILSNDPPPRVAPALRASTAIASGVVDGSARTVVKNRIGVVESGGNDAARNSRSTATGRYQFTEGTWVALYKRRFGDQGLSDAEIAAKRTDAALQNVLMDDLMASNAAALRQAGEAETPGNLYLAHFAGQKGAVDLLRADGAASARQVLGDAVIRANPFLDGMTARDVVAWANRKMGQDYPSPRAGERVEISGGDPQDSLQAMVQAELDRTAGMRAAMGEGMVEAPPAAPARDPGDVEAAPFDGGLETVLVKPKRVARPPRTMDLMQFLAWNGGLNPRGVAGAAGAINPNKGHDLESLFDGNPFIPGAGKLLRPGGQYLDDAIERAWEAGYFGPPATTDRPTFDEFLDALDANHRGDRRFTMADQAEADARMQRLKATDEGLEFQSRLDEAMYGRGIEYDDDFSAEAFDLWDGDFDATIDAVINRRIDDELQKLLAEEDPNAYDYFRQLDEAGYGVRPEETGPAAQSPDEYGFDGGDPRVGGEDAGDGRSADAPSGDGVERVDGAPLPEAEQARWDDPAGEAATAQAESIEHDVRMATADPNVAARQRQEVQLGADAPLRGGNRTGKEQDGTMGLGLFDAADQPEFRLDAEGGTTKPGDLLRQLDEEEAAIQRIKGCIAPKKGDAE